MTKYPMTNEIRIPNHELQGNAMRSWTPATVLVLLVLGWAADPARAAIETSWFRFEDGTPGPGQTQPAHPIAVPEAGAPGLAQHYLDAATGDALNLARSSAGAEISATSERHPVSNLIDDDPHTGYDAQFADEEVEITLSWPDPVAFDCFYWERTRGYQMTAREPEDYDLLVSDDGVQWTTVLQVRDFSGQFHYDRLPTVTTRFFKIHVLQTSGGDGVVFEAFGLYQLGSMQVTDWWDERWQWRVQLDPVEVPAGDHPRAVQARLDFSGLATRPGRQVILDSLRVVERGPEGDILADNGARGLPHRFLTGEGVDQPSGQNGTLLWLAPSSATTRTRSFDVCHAWDDEAAVPPLEQGIPGIRFEATETADDLAYQADDPTLNTIRVYDEFSRLRQDIGISPEGTGTVSDLDLWGQYWALVSGPQGSVGATWLPRSLHAPGTLQVSLPRLVWARAEPLPVTATLPLDSPADTLQVYVLSEGQPLVSSQQIALGIQGNQKSAHVALSSEHLAHGSYRLLAAAHSPDFAVDTRAVTVFVAQPREDGFPYGFYGLPRPRSMPSEDKWRILADWNAHLVLADDLDAALRHRIRIIPKIGNLMGVHHPEEALGQFAIDSRGVPFDVPPHVRLSLEKPLARQRFASSLGQIINSHAGHPGFSGVVFWRDDGQLRYNVELVDAENLDYRWYPEGYGDVSVAAFQARTGQEPPTPQETPKRTGVIPDDDPWILWITYRLDDYYAGLARYLRDVKNGVDPSVALVPVCGGGGPNPYVAVSDGPYPPYDQAAADFINTYYYPGEFWPILDYLWEVQLGWMGNRGRPSWMTTGNHQAGWEKSIRTKFHMVLAAGYDGMIHYVSTETPEIYQPGEGYDTFQELGQWVDDYEALYQALDPGRPKVAVLYPLTSVAFGMAGDLFDYTHHRWFQTAIRTLVRNHVPVTAVAEEEVQQGLLDEFEVLVVPRIQALRQSVYDRIVNWAAAGHPVYLVGESQVQIPGAAVMGVDPMVAAVAAHPAAQPLLKPDTTDAMVNALYVGETPFVYVVNAFADRWVYRYGGAYGLFSPLNPDPHLPDLGYTRANAQPRPTQDIEVTLTAQREGLHLYELYTHESTALTGGVAHLTVPAADGRLLAVYEEPLGETRLQTPLQAAPGETVTVDVEVLDTAGEAFAEPVPVKLSVQRPDGLPSVYSRSMLVREGQAQATLPLAVNDPTGDWQVWVRNLATGVRLGRPLRIETLPSE